MNRTILFYCLSLWVVFNVADVHARSEFTESYHEALSECVSEVDETLARCALTASLRTGQPAPTVYVPLDLQTGEPSSDTEGQVHVCGAEFCDIYDCYEDSVNLMSVCDFVDSRAVKKRFTG